MSFLSPPRSRIEFMECQLTCNARFVLNDSTIVQAIHHIFASINENIVHAWEHIFGFFRPPLWCGSMMRREYIGLKLHNRVETEAESLARASDWKKASKARKKSFSSANAFEL